MSSWKSGPGLHVVYGPVLAVCARFLAGSKPSASRGLFYKSRERHACCTWLIHDGSVPCTCIGSTEYRLKANANDFMRPCCDHSEGFFSFLSRFNDHTETASHVLGKAFAAIVKKYSTPSTQAYLAQLPLFTYSHGGKIAVVAQPDDAGVNSTTSLVPIRCVKRSGMHYICAFCDLVQNNICHHVTTLSSLRIHGGPAVSEEKGRSESSTQKNPPDPDPDWTVMDDINAISHLPVAIVNCPRSLFTDCNISNLAKSGEPFVVQAPDKCPRCSSSRLESGMNLVKTGVVMCTSGPCKMHVQEYDCVFCGLYVTSEGGDNCIVLGTIGTAATHVMLRNEVTGVALSNGTLKNRLRHYHSKVVAAIDSGLLPADPTWRSVRALQNLCVVMCKLMVLSPPPSLFSCRNCEMDDAGNSRRLHALCVDGIWLGYLKSTHSNFLNLSQSCIAMPLSKASGQHSLLRPLEGLIRRDRTVAYLIDAIAGERLTVSDNTIVCVIVAVRILSDNVFPAQYYSESICGRNAQDVQSDIGACVLKRLRRLTTSLFAENVLLWRLLKPTYTYLKRKGVKTNTNSADAGVPTSTEQDGRPWKKKRKLYVAQDAAKTIEEWIERHSGTGSLPSPDNMVCWRDVSDSTFKADVGREVFLLYKTLVQGPVTQFIGIKEVYSVLRVAELCIKSHCGGLMRALTKPHTLSPKVIMAEANVLLNFRLLRGGLLSAVTMDVNAGRLESCVLGVNPGAFVSEADQEGVHFNGTARQNIPQMTIISAFGAVLGEAANCVKSFYAFYDTFRGGEDSASTYADKWNSTAAPVLRASFEKFAVDKGVRRQILEGNCYTQACNTGAYFPAHEQVRPFPFNEDLRVMKDNDIFGICSKAYLQKRDAFTPGSLTFCCSCSHPIILGFKVLEKNEGPRSVLDVIVSRFARFPRSLLYDFACGVYKSAVQNLWWAIEDKTVASDAFQSMNQKCSPGFRPTCHEELNMTNTVAHEQRNRAIAELSRSLTLSSQQ